MKRFSTFEEFWPFYVRAHKNPWTRRAHFVGTSAALAIGAAGLLTRQKWLLLLAPVAGYGPAWLSHFFVEQNLPATFSQPLYSVRADLLMWKKMIDGSMDAEVARVLAPSNGHGHEEPDIVPNMATDGTLN